MEKVWGMTLASIATETIKQVLATLPKEYPNWPPTVGQFLELCKVGKDPILRQALPKPRGDEKIALQALNEMKQKLGIT